MSSPKQDKIPEYPEKFLWGASTAGHQVEGFAEDQWSVWEHENASRLANTADQRLSWIPDYDTKVKEAANDPDNYISGRGVEHLKRYKDDFKLVKAMGLNSFRFTIEWSRIEPEEGVFNAKALKHYQDYVAELQSMGIEPVVNLWHWTHPVWFEEKGAFTRRRNIKYFIRFVKKLAPILREVTWVVTINEPNNVAWFQYVSGEWPPGQKNNYPRAGWTFLNLISAHKKAYIAIKRINANTEITTAHSSSINKPKDPSSLYHRISSKVINYFGNTWYLRRIRNYQDVVGFNFYFVNYVKGVRPEIDFDNPKEPLNDMGWYMEPSGIYDVMKEFSQKFPGQRLMILENGLADREDKNRAWWIEETVQAIDRAVSDGIHVAGYMHWSLLDNFEWAYGWWPAFGLVEVDRENDMKRIPRKSSLKYRSLIEERKAK